MRQWMAVLQALGSLMIVLRSDLPPGTDVALGALSTAVAAALWPSTADRPAPGGDPATGHQAPNERSHATTSERGRSRVGCDSSAGCQASAESGDATDLLPLTESPA